MHARLPEAARIDRPPGDDDDGVAIVCQESVDGSSEQQKSPDVQRRKAGLGRSDGKLVV